ncbi:MAG: zf-HC2 domain-containing protein [Acidobacteria bacterium]|nr:zf-HC2 domain-containing protein [Acidobacteriota bacterium]MCA1609470.1 zf-HC2 domain-containing protein [Acidobacteriota bacterium]
MTAGSHPGRSAEFLSRLHDGELSPAERAHFESHRAHCVECRGAAAEFEAALALYRSSHPSPASPDLAARILRKLQSRPARRPPFGVTFGIDLRWAGAFAAAVIATIVGSAIVAKNEATERRLSRDEAIPISVVPGRKPAAGAPGTPSVVEPAAPSAAAPQAPSAPEPLREEAARSPRLTSRRAAAASGGAGAVRQREEAQGKMAAAPSELKKDKERRDEFAAEPMREKQIAAEAEKDAAAGPPRLASKNAAPSMPSAAAAQAPTEAIASKPSLRASERAGGEGAAAGFGDGASRPVRLVVAQADGAGSPPDLLAPRDVDVPASLRGRSFILVVDAAGRVRQVASEKPAAAQEAAADARKEEIPSLLSLRFTPGDRQRRLLLRVE